MPAVDMVQTGKNIEEICGKAGVTPKDIQNACGLTTANAVYKWRQGQCLPTVDNLAVIAFLCGVKIDDIVSLKMI